MINSANGTNEVNNWTIITFVAGTSSSNGFGAPKPLEEEVPATKVIIVQLLTSFVPLALLIMSVLGSILLGLATPAEAAAIGAFGGLFLAFCYKSLTWKGLKQSVFLTAKTTAVVFAVKKTDCFNPFQVKDL